MKTADKDVIIRAIYRKFLAMLCDGRRAPSRCRITSQLVESRVREFSGITKAIQYQSRFSIPVSGIATLELSLFKHYWASTDNFEELRSHQAPIS